LNSGERYALPVNDDFSLRLASEDDIPELERLISLSVGELMAECYSPAQLEAALGPVFGVDRHLIRDRTYFVAIHDVSIAGCGGWSRRAAVYGGDRDRPGGDELLDPARDAARIRAFFVHPLWTRRGIGRRILSACEDALQTAGFTTAELVGTLTGEPLYSCFGYAVVERYDVPLSNGLMLPVVRMSKSFPSA
jgi:GNAT superfamily N-acetyltransferase